jgi:tripartite-type tricarboxylate transporter receptor subunit TctC
MHRLAASALLCASVSSGWIAAALAEDAETFYRNLGQMNIIVSSAPGGGYDQTARVTGKFMSKYLSGHPTEIVQNMPGGAGIRAANYIYNVAPKDGRTFGLIDRAIPTAPLIYGGETKGMFEATKFSWIGSGMKESGMGAVSAASGVRTLEDAKTKDVFVGSQGPEQDTALYPRLLNVLLGTRFKLIYGYQGQDFIQQAVVSNEVMGMFTSGWSGGAQAFINARVREGTMHTLVYMSTQRDPDNPDTPTLLEVVNTPEDRAMVELILSRMVLGRPFIAPPGIPADRLEMLRDAFRKSYEDPEFQKEAKQRQVAINPIWGQEAEDTIKSIYQAPPAVIERLRKVATAGR